MGYSLSWLAIKGKPTPDILAALGLRATGTTAIEGEAPLVGAPSDGGWYLLVADGAEHELLRPAVLARLSQGCEVLTCTVEEHVMFSQATGWRQGHELWRVTHRGEEGPKGLAESGALPPEYAPIRDALLAQQEAEGGDEADVDYLFDIPVALVHAFTGYRHDAPSPAFEATELEVLAAESAEPNRRSWLGRMLGR